MTVYAANRFATHHNFGTHKPADVKKNYVPLKNVPMVPSGIPSPVGANAQGKLIVVDFIRNGMIPNAPAYD